MYGLFERFDREGGDRNRKAHVKMMKTMKGRRTLGVRLAALTAATMATSALTLCTQTAAHASGPCNGNVIAQHDSNGFSTRLIQSYGGGSICVNTWNQTGGRAWTVAALNNYSGSPMVSPDEGNYYQYASTGFTGTPWGQCVWYGAINNWYWEYCF